MAGSPSYVQNYPVATKRVVRAMRSGQGHPLDQQRQDYRRNSFSSTARWTPSWAFRRSHRLRSTRLPADELYGFAIADCPDDTVASAWDAEQVEGRTVRKGVRWHEAQPAIAGHR